MSIDAADSEENVTAIIFLVSLSDYNSVLIEAKGESSSKKIRRKSG